MRKIGKYRIRGLLGRGGMSKVFKVEIPVIGKILALKLLDPNPLLIDLIGREKLRELFTSEAIKLATLRHQNIVEIWDFGETDGKLYYVMDYYFNNIATMIGETRRTDRPSRIIKLDKAISYTRQTLSGLACLHYAGIVHRDIKPSNLLLTDQETVKVCDFGLSKLRGETVTAPENLKVGSPWYASPEQERNPEDADFRSDLYATGVTLYRMITGKLPRQHPERPSRLNPDLDDNWDAFIARSIAPKPRERFSSTAEMLAELEKLNNAWQQKKENICRIAGKRLKQESKLAAAKFNLRSRAVKVDPRHAQKVFSTDNLWRPQNYIQNVFETHPAGIITDHSTGLSWQQAGSDYPMNWHQTLTYIEELNRNQLAGRTIWRLPTIDELMSLLTETPHGEGFCIERIFDQRQIFLWSSDRRSYTAAWYVSVDMGFVSWQDFSAYYYVRGVCGN